MRPTSPRGIMPTPMKERRTFPQEQLPGDEFAQDARLAEALDLPEQLGAKQGGGENEEKTAEIRGFHPVDAESGPAARD